MRLSMNANTESEGGMLGAVPGDDELLEIGNMSRTDSPTVVMTSDMPGLTLTISTRFRRRL